MRTRVVAGMQPRSSEALYPEAIRLEGQNISHAIEELEVAAQRGNVESYYKLGMIYILGQSVRRNIPLGLRYLAIAAQHGHIPSASQWRWRMALEGVLWSRAKF